MTQETRGATTSDVAAVTAGGSVAAWRLLHVEPNGVDALKLKLALRHEMPLGARIDQAASWSEAEALVELAASESAAYTALLVGCSLQSPEDDAAMRRLIARAGDVPVAILSADDSPGAALAAGRLGVRDFLLKGKLTAESLGELVRRLQSSGGGSLVTSGADLRRAPRYEVVAAAVVIPIHADGRPGREIPASVVELSEVGLAVLAQVDADAVPELCFVGLEGPDGVYRYATVEWRQRRLALPAIHFGGRFVLPGEDPLGSGKLRPQFDPVRFRFRPQLDESLLAEWSARGILRPRVVDRVKCCPECRSLPTFRDGCPQCGSADVAPQQLIHHFACAHVGQVEEFASSGARGGLACPKCQVDRLVVGADFEYLPGPVGCRECAWTDAAPGLIAECLRCGRRFPGHEAVEVDVLAYHAERLDPVAFLANAR